jgi:hypothetical protein
MSIIVKLFPKQYSIVQLFFPSLTQLTPIDLRRPEEEGEHWHCCTLSTQERFNFFSLYFIFLSLGLSPTFNGLVVTARDRARFD